MAKSTKYGREFRRLTKIWKSRKTVKGKRHVAWSGKRGAFSAIRKAAVKEAAKGTGAKRKPAKRKPAKRKPAKRKTAAKRRPAKRKPAKKRTRAAGSGKKPAKRRPSTTKKRYVVGGKKRAGLMTAHQASELRKRTGKKVKLAATQGTGKRKPKGMSTGAKIGLVVLGLVATGAAVVGARHVLKGRATAAAPDRGEEDEF